MLATLLYTEHIGGFFMRTSKIFKKKKSNKQTAYESYNFFDAQK